MNPPKTKPPYDKLPPSPDIDKEQVRREARLVEIGKAEGGDKETRLRKLFIKWRDPDSFPLKTSEEKELLEYRVILPMAASRPNSQVTTDIDVCDSMEELASRMMLHFQNPDKTSKLRIEITKQVISKWATHKQLAATIPKFPTIKGGRTRYSLRAAIEWFNNHLWHDYRVNAEQANGATISPFVSIGELREKIERAELEKRDFDIMVERGGYIATAKAAAILGGAMAQYHSFLKNRLETTSPEAFEVFWSGVGLTPEQIAASKDFLIKEFRRAIDDLETEAISRAAANNDRMAAQVKQDNGQ